LRRAALAAALLALGLGAAGAQAAGPPALAPVWADGVGPSAARLHGEVGPEGLATSYRFEYTTAAAYEAGLGAGGDGFAGAATAPPGAEAALAAGSEGVAVSQPVTALAAATTYVFRLVARNGAGAATSAAASFTTEPPAPIVCEGDSCQVLPPEPVDPPLDTLIPGPGNPKVHYARAHRRRVHRRRHRHHRHRKHRRPHRRGARR
jgi:hypothetical protein